MYIKIFMLVIFIFSSIANAATKFYTWIDQEGIKQFSSTPPPRTCQTQSCRKIHQQYTKMIDEKKVKIKQEKEKAQKTAKKELLKRTTLLKGVVLCNKYEAIKEYEQVEEARKYLIQEKQCYLLESNIKYSFVRTFKKLSKIRIYTVEGNSYIRWVLSNNIVIPKNRSSSK